MTYPHSSQHIDGVASADLAVLEAQQAGAETTVNAAIVQLFARVACSVISRATTAEPGAPAEGDRYLLPTSSTGTYWAGNDGRFAYYFNATWYFVTVEEGWRVWVNDENAWLVYDGSAWIRLGARVQSVASAATVTPNPDADDMVRVTALAAACQLINPTPTTSRHEGQRIVVRIKDDATPRALTYDTQYRAMGTALPSTTVASKTLYLTFVFNSTDTKWDLVHAAQEA